MSGTADQQMEMPCLGRPFQLGTLYDFRNDSLIPGVTLWGPETLGTATCTKMEGSDFEVITEDSLNEKALHLDVSAGLKLSVLGGLVKAGGSGKFLYDRTTSKNQARVSLKYRATSRFEQLNMNHLGKFEYPRVFDDDIATHVVTGVLYGADAIFVFDRQVERIEKLKQVHGNLEAMIKALPSFDLNVGGGADLDIQKKGKKGVEEIHCKFYGDFILPKNPTTYQDAVRVYQELPKLLGGVGYPNSVAKNVWLYPLSKLDSKVHRLVREISSWLIYDVQELLESLHELEIQTNDLIQNEVCNYFHESKGDLKKLKRLIGSYRITLLRRLSTLLPQVRGGGADETKLAELLKENRMSPFSYERLSSWISGKELETSTLAVYLEELKEHQIQFAFSSAEMVVITKNFNKETILCFDFNILAGNDSCLQKMEAYLREETVSQELQVQKSWYKTREMRQAFQRFVNFVKTNTGREGVKYVVTNGSGDTTESIEKVGVLFMYEDACPTMFEPPDQPGKPQALSVTHNSIQLKWDKPNYGATSVQSYTAAYHTSDDPIDQWCTQASDEECLELTNLTPGSLYYFKVTAETSVGSSPTSEVSEAIQLPPDQPGKPHASEKKYKCVELKWSRPKHGADIVQHYTVLYQSTDAQWYKKTSKEEFLLLTNLTPGSLYSFKVVAESSAGCSPSSEVSEVQLPPDQPGKPLTTEVTHNSVQLKWDKPKHGKRIVECYKFFHRLADNPPREWLIQETDKEFLYLKKLTPGSLYYFKVIAESSAGSSPESAVNEVWLPPDQPGKPEYQGMTHNSLRLKWSKPKHGADIVQSYILSYCSVDDPPYQWSTQTCSEEHSMLTKLIPASVYQFKVSANSRAGPGPASEVSEVMLPPDKPGTPHVSGVTHNSLQLTWAKPKHGAGIVQSYTVSYQPVDSPDSQWCTQTSSEECLVLTKLTPGLLYHIKVTANSSAGSSQVSEMSKVRLPPGQPGKPHASVITHSSIQLEWSKPKHGAEIVKYYTLSYQSTDDQWCKMTREEKFLLHTNLIPGSLYSFKVVAESSVGSSPSSEVSEVQLPPDQPGKPFATEVTHNSVQLTWGKPKHGNKIVNGYKLFYCLADNPPREWLIQEIDKECLYLKKLTPGSLYYFKVTAESSAGSSPKSAVSEVWLPPDQPGKPEIKGMTHNSLQLKWSKPKHGADIVQSYTISYHSVDSPDSQWCTQTSSEECLVLTKLTPGLLYHIKVTANSSAGSSPCSEMSEVRLPPGQPGKPHASRITHSSIQLEWSKSKHGAEIVKYYTLSYQSTDGQWYKTTREEKFLLHTKLTPGSLYSFKVVAESSVGSSPSSEVTEVQLPPDQPGKPEILDITHNSIQLQWFKPKHGAGIVKSYIVSYSSVDDLQDQRRTQASIKECSVLVTKLIPGMLYCFKVTADSPAGLSPASEVREIRLPPDQPGKPVASDATYNSVCLKWTKPEHGAETVQSYSISCQAVDNQCHNINTTSNHEYVTVTNLTPKTVYTFKVRAVSAAGHGPDSDLSNPIEMTLPPPGKPHASNVTYNSLQLNWEKPSHGADSVEFYTVSYCTGNISLNQWDTERTPVAAESIQLDNLLLAKTVYYFKVRAESATGPSPDSELSDPIETVSPISQPGKPTATKVTHDSIALKWEKPEHGADDVKHYILKYYALDQQDRWFTYTRLGSQASVCLTGLQPQTIYMFKVRAESSVVSSLDSKHSDPIETSKLPPPGRPYASNASYTGFQVNWQQPCYGDIHHYIVSYRTTDELSDNWHKVKTDDYNSSVFFNGTEGTFYVFKVAAVTAAGVSSDSEVSDVIQTKAIPLICKGLDPISKSNPLTYLLPTHCVMEKNGISKVHVGANSHGIIKSGVHTSCSCHTRTAGVPHKVLMLVGATGAGKTTLINGMANYIMGVQWDEDLRFKLIHEPNSQDQTVSSQTRCITSYTFYKEKDSPLPYTLTVIDTPGFGEVNRDKQIFKQIKELFSIEGFDQLHGIGFVTQAPIRQLTPTQQYVCDTTLSMFGKDVADNIFLMITFADGLKPPVLDVVKAAKVPYQEFFMFNNSADDEFNKMLWRIGVYGFVVFFQKFSTAKAKSLRLSIKVIQEYETLERAIQGMHYAVPVFCGSPVFTVQRGMQELACRSIKQLQEIALKPNYLFKVKYIDLIIETEKREATPRWLDRVRALEGVRQQADIVTKLIENPGSEPEKNSEPQLGVSHLLAKSILSLSGIYD